MIRLSENNKLEIMWNDTIVTWALPPRHLPGKTEENHETVYSASRARIKTKLAEGKVRNMSTTGNESAVTTHEGESKRYGR
jgi:hypothetical protein